MCIASHLNVVSLRRARTPSAKWTRRKSVRRQHGSSSLRSCLATSGSPPLRRERGQRRWSSRKKTLVRVRAQLSCFYLTFAFAILLATSHSVHDLTPPDVVYHRDCTGRFEEGAPEFWDLFYARNQNNFFRERNYLWHSFPLLEEFPHTHGGGEKSTCSVGEPCASESSSSLAKGSGHQDSSTTEKGKRGMGVGYMDGGEGKGRPPGVLMEVGYALTSVRVLRSIADFILTQVSLQLWHWQYPLPTHDSLYFM